MDVVYVCLVEIAVDCFVGRCNVATDCDLCVVEEYEADGRVIGDETFKALIALVDVGYDCLTFDLAREVDLTVRFERLFRCILSSRDGIGINVGICEIY